MDIFPLSDTKLTVQNHPFLTEPGDSFASFEATVFIPRISWFMWTQFSEV